MTYSHGESYRHTSSCENISSHTSVSKRMDFDYRNQVVMIPSTFQQKHSMNVQITTQQMRQQSWPIWVCT